MTSNLTFLVIPDLVRQDLNVVWSSSLGKASVLSIGETTKAAMSSL